MPFPALRPTASRLTGAVIVVLVALVLGGALAARVGDARPYGARADSGRAADAASRARQDSVNRAQPGYVVDSIFPVEEELRRFHARFPRPVTHFVGGASSRDQLVRHFGNAVARGDLVALRRLALSEAEFGYLLYPSSPHANGPLRQAPGLVWMQISSRSEAGLARLLQRVQRETIRGYACGSTPERQGPNVLWTRCRVRVAGGERLESWRGLFGTIVERDGVFKFVSYANDF